MQKTSIQSTDVCVFVCVCVCVCVCVYGIKTWNTEGEHDMNVNTLIHGVVLC
jgi:hypothetical protein